MKRKTKAAINKTLWIDANGDHWKATAHPVAARFECKPVRFTIYRKTFYSAGLGYYLNDGSADQDKPCMVCQRRLGAGRLGVFLPEKADAYYTASRVELTPDNSGLMHFGHSYALMAERQRDHFQGGAPISITPSETPVLTSYSREDVEAMNESEEPTADEAA